MSRGYQIRSAHADAVVEAMRAGGDDGRATKSMSARVRIDESVSDQAWIEVRQSGAEVIRFLAFTLVVLGSPYGLIPGARTAPGILLALVGIASGWSVVALSGREVYTIDGVSGQISVLISSSLGRHTQWIRADEVTAVHMVTGGPDNDRLLVELVATDGTSRLRLPHRITTLSRNDQLAIGDVVARLLVVPLKETGRVARL